MWEDAGEGSADAGDGLAVEEGDGSDGGGELLRGDGEGEGGALGGAVGLVAGVGGGEVVEAGGQGWWWGGWRCWRRGLRCRGWWCVGRGVEEGDGAGGGVVEARGQ